MRENQADVDVQDGLQVLLVDTVVDIRLETNDQIEEGNEERALFGMTTMEFVLRQRRQARLQRQLDDVQVPQEEVGIFGDVLFEEEIDFEEVLHGEKIVAVQTDEKVVHDVVVVRVDHVLLFDVVEEIREDQVEVLVE